jgi:transcriptional regulator with XRE-family HTH domain
MTEPNVFEYFNETVSTEQDRRRYAQNSLIVDTAITINAALESREISQKDLALRLNRTEGFISQILSGGANLTLRTLADVAYGLDCIVQITIQPSALAGSGVFSKPQTLWSPVAIAQEPPKAAADTQLALAA